MDVGSRSSGLQALYNQIQGRNMYCQYCLAGCFCTGHVGSGKTCVRCWNSKQTLNPKT